MVQHVGSVVEMQRGEACITFPQGAGGFIQTAEQQQCKSRIHIAFVHSDGKQEHSQNDKSTEAKIA